MGRIMAVAGALLAVLLTAAPALADTIVLPPPGAGAAQDLAIVCNSVVGATPDRCKKSKVPGPVVNDEVVLVGLDGTGRPAKVELEQRLVLTKVGDYVVRERGPARSALGLVAGSDPPNTKFGAVVWQGFTPGNRRLGARLTLDAALEELRLPLGVSVTFTPDGGAPRPLDPDGRVPGPGSVLIHLDNRTSQPAELPTGADALPAALAGPLDAALRAARAPAGPRLPAAGGSLPAQLTVTNAARRQASQSVPLRVSGLVKVVGADGTVTGPGTTAVPGGAVVAGTLSGEGGAVDFTAAVPAAARIDLALNVVPALDVRLLLPPRNLPTWAAWARSTPPIAERRAALDLLVATAATGARASSYSPYLGADLPGTGTTVFRYAFAPAQKAAAVQQVLHPKHGAIALAALATLLLLANGALIWSRS